MFRIEVDTLSNIITLYFAGRFNVEQGEELSALFAEELNKLRSGFKLITDLTELESMDLDVHRSIDHIMDLCNKKQVAEIVRVVTNKDLDIGFSIMSLFHYSKDVAIQTYGSIEEAKRYLNENNCREGINGVT